MLAPTQRVFFVIPLILYLYLLAIMPAHAFLGTELGPLIQLVSGQVTEIEKLTETLGTAKEQTKLLQDLNQGIEKTVNQIQALEAILDRSRGLDPSSVRSISDLNDLMYRAKSSQAQLSEVMEVQVMITDQAITEGAIQSDTSYKMGQEMVSTGAKLAAESQSASPGRAAQISAATGSAQMLAQGVELQTMAQLVQLQSISLELQKSQLQKELQSEQARRLVYEGQLANYAPKKSGKRRLQ